MPLAEMWKTVTALPWSHTNSYSYIAFRCFGIIHFGECNSF